MSFDDIPEDKEPSFPCACGGEIKLKNNGKWECDDCGFSKPSKEALLGGYTMSEKEDVFEVGEPDSLEGNFILEIDDLRAEKVELLKVLKRLYSKMYQDEDNIITEFDWDDYNITESVIERMESDVFRPQKPCPFCGGMIEHDEYSGNEYVCKNCNLWGIDLDWWNQRPMEDKLKLEKEELENKLFAEKADNARLKDEKDSLLEALKEVTATLRSKTMFNGNYLSDQVNISLGNANNLIKRMEEK